jgi:dolichol-phosphate mannosyltransferase
VLSVVIPVYCNARSLSPLFERLLAVERELSGMGVQLEIVFTDDGSSDDSIEVLRGLRDRRSDVVVVKLARNFGSMAAIRAGITHARGDAIAILAADLQDPPELLPEMARRWLHGSKFVVCARRRREDPPLSKAFSRLYYVLLQSLVTADFPQGGFDLALFDRLLVPYLLSAGKTSYLLVLVHWLGFRPDIIPYDRAAREHGRSRWTFSKKLNAALDVLLGFSVTPIRVISGIGFLVASASFCYAAFQVVRAIAGKTDVPGFVSIVSLVTFLIGLVIVMLGVIGEYLWRILVEVNGRPYFVVEQVLRGTENGPSGGRR